MLQQYKAARDYIDAARGVGMPADTLNEIKQTQKTQLKASFMLLHPTQADVTSTLIELRTDSESFTEIDRLELATVAHQAFANGPVARSIGNATTKTSQTHMYMHHYLPAHIWDKLVDPALTDHERFLSLITFSHEVLGLRYPTEPTVAHVISVVIVASKKSVTAEQSYAMKNTYADLNDKQRVTFRGQPLTMREFPMSVDEFIAAHPNAYMPNHPPIGSRVSDRLLREVRASVVCRKSSKLLKPSNAIMTGGMNGMNPNNMIQMLQTFQAFQGILQQGGNNDPCIHILNSAQRRAAAGRGAPAIADVLPPGGGAGGHGGAIANVAGAGEVAIVEVAAAAAGGGAIVDRAAAAAGDAPPDGDNKDGIDRLLDDIAEAKTNTAKAKAILKKPAAAQAVAKAKAKGKAPPKKKPVAKAAGKHKVAAKAKGVKQKAKAKK